MISISSLGVDESDFSRDASEIEFEATESGDFKINFYISKPYETNWVISWNLLEFSYSESETTSTLEQDSFSDDDDAPKSQDKQSLLYPGGRLTIQDFNASFLLICQKLNLSNTNRDLLLIFIKNILPAGNFVPITYARLTKSLKKRSFSQKKKICGLCSKTDCTCFSNDFRGKKITKDLIVFDIAVQLEAIVEKNANQIREFAGIYAFL